MTEYELISLVIERRTELVSPIQWWASISVGIIAATCAYPIWVYRKGIK